MWWNCDYKLKNINNIQLANIWYFQSLYCKFFGWCPVDVFSTVASCSHSFAADLSAPQSSPVHRQEAANMITIPLYCIFIQISSKYFMNLTVIPTHKLHLYLHVQITPIKCSHMQKMKKRVTQFKLQYAY